MLESICMSLEIKLEPKNIEADFKSTLEDTLLPQSVNLHGLSWYDLRYTADNALEHLKFYNLFGNSENRISLAVVSCEDPQKNVVKDAITDGSFPEFIFTLNSIEYYFNDKSNQDRTLAARLVNLTSTGVKPALIIETNNELNPLTSDKRCNFKTLTTPMTKFDSAVVQEVYRNIIYSVSRGFYLDPVQYGGEQRAEMRRVVQDICQYVHPNSIGWVLRFVSSFQFPINFEKKLLKGKI